jgi:hypothetical protein
MALLERDALPALEGMQREGDLIALWKTGKGPGLAEAARLRFLARLLHRAERYEEVAAVRAELEQKATSAFVLHALEEVRALKPPKTPRTQ